MLKLIKKPAIRRAGMLCAFAFGMVTLVTACHKDQVVPQSNFIQTDSIRVRVSEDQPPKDADGGPGGRRAGQPDSTQIKPSAQPPKDVDGGPGN